MVLDDWTLGVGPSPEQLQDRLLRQGGMMNMDGGMIGQGGSAELGGAGGMIDYPLYLLNGHPPTDPPTIRARPGQRLRLRVVNAAADTAFRLALGGHRLTVTHTDGFPVAPMTADALLVGMGERCDALVTLGEGAFPLVALAEGSSQVSRYKTLSCIGSSVGCVICGTSLLVPAGLWVVDPRAVSSAPGS